MLNLFQVFKGDASMLPKLQRLTNWKEEKSIITGWIKSQARSDYALNILEAGCGQNWDLDLEGIQYILTGIDIDEVGLEFRKNQQKDIHIAILGDLRTVTLPEKEYDVIFNSFVLEHIDGAERVLDNFIQWLKPGGILILRIPDRDSVFGFLTRVTPFWFHVFFLKYIRGYQNAGKPGYPPFPTVYNKVVSRNGIYKFCEKHGLGIKAEYCRGITTKQIRWILIRGLMRIVNIASLGRYATGYIGLGFVIEKS